MPAASCIGHRSLTAEDLIAFGMDLGDEAELEAELETELE